MDVFVEFFTVISVERKTGRECSTVLKCDPSLIVSPHIFEPKLKTFSHLKLNNFISGTQNMLFHNLICCFPVIFTLFYPKYELKFSVLLFLIMAPPQKLVIAPGATIRDNTVLN